MFREALRLGPAFMCGSGLALSQLLVFCFDSVLYALPVLLAALFTCHRCKRMIEPGDRMLFVINATPQNFVRTVLAQFERTVRWHWQCAPQPLRQYASATVELPPEIDPPADPIAPRGGDLPQ